MKILRSQMVILWSWGFHNAKAISDGLSFLVNGLNFKGTVNVVYNGGSDLFDVSFIKRGVTVETIEGVYFDSLVRTIDEYVENNPNYIIKAR